MMSQGNGLAIYMGIDILRKAEDLREVCLSQGRESKCYGTTYLSFCFCSRMVKKTPNLCEEDFLFFLFGKRYLLWVYYFCKDTNS